MIDVKVINGEIEEQEKFAYIKRGIEKYGEENLLSIDVELDGEYVNIILKMYLFKELEELLVI